MNKAVVARQIPLAYKVLEDSEIVRKKENYKLVSKGYRGQISSFGAAITMGSLIPAIAFFSNKKKEDKSDQSKKKDENEDVDRTKLMKAIFLLLKADADRYGIVEQKRRLEEVSDLMQYVCKMTASGTNSDQNRKALKKCTEDIENAAIALKLAIGMYLDSVPGEQKEV